MKREDLGWKEEREDSDEGIFGCLGMMIVLIVQQLG